MFSRETIEFLIENRLRNDREWFNANKDRYQKHVIDPFVSLVMSLTPVLHEIDPGLICSPKVSGSISRIWRDARFSRDKSLFREMMWCMFTREKGVNMPEFFFVLSPEWFMYGGGYYSAGSASMNVIRELLLADDPDAARAVAAYDGQDVFGLDGDKYKRPRYPDAPENLRGWLERKNICFIHKSTDYELLYSDRLADVIANGYQLLAPVYRFLIKAEGIVRNSE